MSLIGWNCGRCMGAPGSRQSLPGRSRSQGGCIQLSAEPNRFRWAWRGLAALFGLFAAVPALGQARLPLAAPAPASPLPGIAPRAVPNLAPGLEPPPEPEAAEMPDVSLNVARVVVEGSTVYPAESFAALLDGLTGAEVALARVEAARIAILRRYRDDGYALTAVSAVAEAGGTLRLRVTEGRIAAVRLDGDIGPAGVQVLRFLERLTEKRVIDTATLERWLLLAGDVPGVTVRAVLRQSTDEPGALTLIAQVSRQAWGGQATLDNRAFDQVGPEQGLLVVDLNSLTEFGEHTQAELYRTVNGAQIFGMVETDAFIGASGLRIRVSAGTGLSRPGGVFRTIGYVGRTTTMGAELTYPLIRSRRQTLNLSSAFDAVESAIEQAGQLSSRDVLRIARLGAEYVLSDTLLGTGRGGVSTVTIRLSHGLHVLGAARDGAALAGRAGQRSGFLKATAEISRTQTLFQPWEGASVALFGLVAGQWTHDVLPPAEKFFLGGSRYTRGFYYGQVTGDRALAATVELQLNMVRDLELFGAAREVAAQLYAFYDWGASWEVPAEDRGRRLQSAGLGLRLIPSPRLEVDLELVKRLTRFPTGSGAGIAPLPELAFYWRVLARV